MMQEFYNELQSGKGPVFLKLDHLHEDTVKEIADTLHNVERPTRGRFHENRSTDYNNEMIEMHISEIGFCSATAHPVSGWTNMRARQCLVSTRRATWRAFRTLHAGCLHQRHVRRRRRGRLYR